MYLPYVFPLRAVTAPKTNEIGHHFLGVLDLLWNAPIVEVREACLSAIKNPDFHSSSYKVFQSNTKDLEENHALVQRTVCALISEGYDTDVVVELLDHYLEYSFAAWRSDWTNLPLEKRGEEKVILPSGVLFEKAFRFAVRLLVMKQPRFLKLGKLESNSLHCDPCLLRILLHRRYSPGGAILASRAAGRCLWNRIRKGFEMLDEERWKVFEELFRFGIEPEGKMHYSLFVYHKYLREIAQLVCSGRLSFGKDPSFGGLLEARARYICEKYLEVVPVT